MRGDGRLPQQLGRGDLVARAEQQRQPGRERTRVGILDPSRRERPQGTVDVAQLLGLQQPRLQPETLGQQLGMSLIVEPGGSLVLPEQQAQVAGTLESL